MRGINFYESKKERCPIQLYLFPFKLVFFKYVYDSSVGGPSLNLSTLSYSVLHLSTQFNHNMLITYIIFIFISYKTVSFPIFLIFVFNPTSKKIIFVYFLTFFSINVGLLLSPLQFIIHQ